jgi:nucleotide-binding universal stress UspA family protein
VTIARIVVGTDGSDNAASAVACAADLARATGADLVVVCAVGLLATAASPGTHREINEQLEGEWTEHARLPGVRMQTEVRDGNPVQVLLAVADDVDADLIVVGSRGFGGFPELLLGSTSTQLAQHSRRPVLIVPMADPQPAQ